MSCSRRFADIDVFDIELGTHDPDEIIKTCQLLEPTFGGINLEDIKAPECFYIEETLKKTMKIPVFHDDQHGTAIISGAALVNAVELTGKRIDQIKVVVNGAGRLRHRLRRALCLHGREAREHHAGRHQGRHLQGPQRRNESLQGALRQRDVDAHAWRMRPRAPTCLLGLSKKGAFTPAMIASLAPRPVVFAMANPDPEITYDEARAVRDDIIMATGRSDYPNQVNNVLGFPFIFRGALDVHATTINEEMKLAATQALGGSRQRRCSRLRMPGLRRGFAEVRR